MAPGAKATTKKIMHSRQGRLREKILVIVVSFLLRFELHVNRK